MINFLALAYSEYS